MNPLATFALYLDHAQALGFIKSDTTAEDVEALFNSLGPGDDDNFDEPPDEEQEICDECGGPADECEHSRPPTGSDRAARERWEEPG